MTVRQRPESRGEGLYALSFLGAHLAFIPILALLLPRRVAAISPASSIELLSVLLLAGGIVASIAHIVAGRWSDHWLRRHGSRRGLILIGLGLLILSQIALGLARSDISLLLAITVFQLSLNLMFAPLGALLADYIPNERKGRVAGMMNASLPLASLGTGAVAFLFPTDNVLAFL
ncbi:MAG TPA: MFS transporter, partial [Sphingomicrobium sp.]|nr:MFS transporter [Sphingomicrobium sp.]